MVHEEVLALMAQADRHPKTEIEAALWLMLLQYRAAFVFNRINPMKWPTTPKQQMKKTYAATDAVRIEAAKRFPRFSVLTKIEVDFDINAIGIKVIPPHEIVDELQFIVACALELLVRQHVVITEDQRTEIMWERPEHDVEVTSKQANHRGH